MSTKKRNVAYLFHVVQPMHRKKRFTSFLSSAGMSLTKLPLFWAGIIQLWRHYSRPGEFGSDIPAGDGKLANLFLRCACISACGIAAPTLTKSVGATANFRQNLCSMSIILFAGLCLGLWRGLWSSRASWKTFLAFKGWYKKTSTVEDRRQDKSTATILDPPACSQDTTFNCCLHSHTWKAICSLANTLIEPYTDDLENFLGWLRLRLFFLSWGGGGARSLIGEVFYYWFVTRHPLPPLPFDAEQKLNKNS